MTKERVDGSVDLVHHGTCRMLKKRQGSLVSAGLSKAQDQMDGRFTVYAGAVAIPNRKYRQKVEMVP